MLVLNILFSIKTSLNLISDTVTRNKKQAIVIINNGISILVSILGVESFDYGNVETAADVGWENYKRAVDGIVRLYEHSGLFHGYSFNSWSDVVTYDREFLKDWLDCPQTSLYYSLQVLPDTQRKDDAYAALDDDFKSMFALDEEDLSGTDDATEACPLTPPDSGFCAACAE